MKIKGVLLIISFLFPPKSIAFEVNEYCIPTPASQYAFAEAIYAHNNGEIIDLDFENKKVSCYLHEMASSNTLPEYPMILVLGYSSNNGGVPVQLNSGVKKRLKEAVDLVTEFGALGIMVSGGNVHPKNTPFNESFEMKQYLLELGVEEKQIAIDPYARHTTTNLRNTGRFLLKHGVKKVLIYTSKGQTKMFQKNKILFSLRSYFEMGLIPGKFKSLTDQLTIFEPSRKVFYRGPSKKDP